MAAVYTMLSALKSKKKSKFKIAENVLNVSKYFLNCAFCANVKKYKITTRRGRFI